ncbi:MAG: ParA family protein [bacterium]
MSEPVRPKYILTTAELCRLCGLPPGAPNRFFSDGELVKMPGGKTGIPSGMVRGFLEQRGADYSFKVLAHINMRGGVGKTTSTISLATRAVQFGFKTCILDMDSQGSSSLAFNIVPGDDDLIFCDVWDKPSKLVMQSLNRIDDNLYILPSSLDNSVLDVKLSDPEFQKNAVSGVCGELKANGFDLVVVDCPPSLGTAVISTICAADMIVIPVCSDAFSFKGLEITLEEIFSIRSTFGLVDSEVKVLFTQFDRRRNISLAAKRKLSRRYKDYLISVFIRKSDKFSKLLEKRETVFAYTMRGAARNDYDGYARYVLGLNKVLDDRREK